MGLNYHVEEAKAGVLLVNDESDECFGVIHVKASIAGRRQNDQNFSLALLKKNYFLPFMTMGCKSTPSEWPINKGEFGDTLGKNDSRIDKRKEFEEEGYFSGCYSYNKNTKQTPNTQKATSRIYQLDFNDPNDIFSKNVILARDRLFKG